MLVVSSRLAVNSLMHAAAPAAGAQLFRFIGKAPMHGSSSVNGGREIVNIPTGSLQASYKRIIGHLDTLATEMKVTAVVSPLLSVGWLAFTQQPLWESPVAVACLLAGGAMITNRTMQYFRVKRYAELSAMTDPSHLSQSQSTNQKALQIIAGNDAKVNVGTKEITVSGFPVVIGKPSSLANVDRIGSIARVVIPGCVVHPEAASKINFTHQRWLARITFPLSILNLIAILSKDSKDRRLDDYVVAASSAHNVYDYLSGPSVGEARTRFTSYLQDTNTSHEVLSKLIHPEDLQGGLSFLKRWSKDAASLSVRVGRTGEIVLYKGEKSSFGGPFPAESFPSKKKLP